MTDNSTTRQEQADKEKRTKLLSEAYTAATKRLREGRRDEFDALYSEEAANRGIDWKPKPSAEQKAKQEMQRLLEQHPHLRDQLVAEGNRPEQEDLDDDEPEGEPDTEEPPAGNGDLPTDARGPEDLPADEPAQQQAEPQRL